jgi:nucleotide-binding universal stress UspA family protein
MKILYATDGSEGALTAGRLLGALPHLKDAYVHVFTVRDPDDEVFDAAPVIAGARQALGAFPAHVTTSEAPGVGTGGVVEQVLFAADAVGADLIVVGATGRSAVSRFFVGSVAESVARHAHRPVLVARPPQGAAIDRVLVGFDGSELSADAARWAVRHLPLLPGCAVRLFSVIVPPALASGFVGGNAVPYMTDFLDQAVREGYKAAEESLARLTTELRAEVAARGDAGPRIETKTFGGSAAPAILDEAREFAADLIAVGSHGATGAERFLLGSVAESVLRHAPCSVLVVKRPR